MGFGKPVSPLALSVLYPHGLNLNASPQTISGRTSYLRARLAFHPYPQVIQCFFNNNRFGPPREVNHASPCSWIDRSVSGLLQRTNSPYSDSLSLRLRLNTLTKPVTSNSQVHSSIGTRLALSYDMGLSRFVGARFHVLFHSPPGVLFTFPSRYSFTIGYWKIFSLGRWSSQLQTGFLVPRPTQEQSTKSERFNLRDYHRLWCGFPAGFGYRPDFLLCPRY